MKRFIAEAGRAQTMLLPECLDDWIDENNPVRVIDVFVEVLNLAELGFAGVEPGRPSYHPSVLACRLSLTVQPPLSENPVLLHERCVAGSGCD